MRIMALDYGSKTVGVAMTDPLGITVQPSETITRKQENHLRKTYVRIEEITRENAIGLIVVGLPVNMDGTEGERAALCRQFGEKIRERTGIRVCYQDERLTTVEADEILEAMEISRGERKKHIDAIAASIILQDYINSSEYGKTSGITDI
jgi:putative holliday junction resolvase